MQTINFRNASKEQIDSYFRWFASTTLERINNFIAMFNERGGDNKLDFTPKSLVELASWLKINVQYRSKTEAEIGRFLPSTPDYLQHALKEPVLTKEWSNHSIDVGTYIGAVFKKAFPPLEWQISQEGQNNVNFGQPVLVCASGFEFPVLNVTYTFMAGLYNNTAPAKRIMSVYEYWENALQARRQTIAVNEPPV